MPQGLGFRVPSDMGTKKAKKALNPASDGVAGEAQVQGSEKKKEKVKAKSEIGDVFGQKIQAQELEKKEKVKEKVKAKSEIDDIFGQKKRKKAEVEDEQAAAKKKETENSEVMKLNSKGELVKPKKPKVAKPAVSAKSTPAAAGSTSRKKTEDGFTIYTAEELGFNKKNAGGSKLCPFDCDCCF